MAGVNGCAEPFAEEINQRHDDEPGKDTPGENDAGNSGADDVADTEIF